MTQEMPLRVAIIGFGAIGQRVAHELQRDAVPGVKLAGAIVRTPGRAADAGVREFDLSTALAEADLIVECAGGDTVRDVGVRIIESGRDLLIVSVGALIDAQLRESIVNGGPGRAYLSTGGIGGLDLLRAASLAPHGARGLDSASLTTAKLPATLVQPWMSEDEATHLRNTTTPVTVFEGTVERAIEKFPNSLNIAVALAAATGLWEETMVRLVGDPEATLTSHRIEAAGTSGNYVFDMTNHPLVANPASSAVVSQALLSGIAKIAHPSGTFI